MIRLFTFLGRRKEWIVLSLAVAMSVWLLTLEQEKKLEELRAERQRAVINSPINGVVLHGKLTRGRISEKASVLGADSKLTAEQVIATIVDTTKLQVRVDLAETNLSRLQVGQNGSVSVAAVPAFAGSGVVKSVSRVPYAGTKYDCVVALKKSKQAGLLMPTMTCTLEFANDETSKDGNEKTRGRQDGKTKRRQDHRTRRRKDDRTDDGKTTR